MSHFGSPNWNNPCGVVAGLSLTGNTSQTGAAATYDGAVEGTDLLTYRTVRTGLYRVTATIRNNVASNAGTSNTFSTTITYSNGTAVAKAIMQQVVAGGSTATGVDFVAGAVGATWNAQMTFMAATGTDIVLNVRQVVVGAAATLGKYDLNWAIEAI
jgi:hypothetical protein